LTTTIKAEGLRVRFAVKFCQATVACAKIDIELGRLGRRFKAELKCLDVDIDESLFG